MTTLLVGLGRALWWFLVGWMCAFGFGRLFLAVFARKPMRRHMAEEMRILRLPFGGLEALEIGVQEDVH